MTRTVVLRASATSASTPATILNDEIGLDPFLSYTIQEHIEDLSGEGIRILSAEGNFYRFSDGSACFLDEMKVRVNQSALDLETLVLVRAHDINIAIEATRIHAVGTARMHAVGA